MPAEIVGAKETHHMVTTFVFLDFGATHGAKFDSLSLVFGPAFIPLFHGFFTRLLLAMILIATLKTECRLAFGTLKFDYLSIFGAHKALTARLDAPSHESIPLYVLFLLKSRVFFQNLWHVNLEQPVELFVGDRRIALVRQTGNLAKFAPFDVQLELPLATLFAKAVLARKLKR